jgi:transposase
MAYRELGVIELREVWRRYSAGDGVRVIARGTGVDRKTIAKYVAAAVAVGLSRGAPPPTDEQLAEFVRGLRGTPVGRPAALPERLAPYQAQIAAWLGDGLRLTKIHRRLREQGVGVPYSSLHRFAQAHCGFGAPSVTVRVAEPPPGEAAEVDFGRLGLWPDPVAGTRRHVYGLLVTLAFSRYAFLWVALRQDLPTVLAGLEAAWGFFQGVVRRLVVDNLKPVITRADRYTPTIDRVFLEYAPHRGFLVDPAVPRHATGKPKVERGIPYVRQDFFRGEVFPDLDDMQARAVTWPAPGSTAPPVAPRASSSRPRSRPRSCRWDPSPSIRPPGPSAPSTPITTSSSSGPSTRSRPATSAPRSTSAATRAWSGSISTAS